MRDGWAIRTIGEVCDIRSGRNQKEVENPSGKYPIYGSGGIMGYADDYLCEAGATIIGRKGSINNPIYVETKFWNVDTAFGFSPKETILPKFLFYFCKGFNFQAMNKGTTIPSLVKSDLLQIRIPVPSIPEQQRIIGILDQGFAKIDALKANAEKALQAAKDLFQTSLKKELGPKEGWISEALSSICRVINGRAYSKEEFFETGKYRVLRVGNFFTNDKWYYSNLELEEEKYCEQGDLLYAWSASFGPRIWLEEKVIYHYHIWKLVNKEDTIRKKFLYYWLMSPFFMSQTMNDLHGTTMVHITKGIMERAIVSFPSVSVQDSIVREIEQASHLCSSLQENYQKTLSLCDDLKQALLRKAFNGEL